MWDQLRHHLQPSSNQSDLKDQSQQLWADLPEERIQRLYNRVLYRSYKTWGGATPYWDGTSSVPVLTTQMNCSYSHIFFQYMQLDLSFMTLFVNLTFFVNVYEIPH